jgi:hypothetical protein
VLKPQNVADEYAQLYSMEKELVLSSNCVRTISKTTAFSANPLASASAFAQERRPTRDQHPPPMSQVYRFF